LPTWAAAGKRKEKVADRNSITDHAAWEEERKERDLKSPMDH